jgi:hypothetical protein
VEAQMHMTQDDIEIAIREYFDKRHLHLERVTLQRESPDETNNWEGIITATVDLKVPR